MKRMKKLLAVLLALSLLTALSACSGSSKQQSSESTSTESGEASEATNWPEKPVTIISPYNPGGDSDFNARALAEKLTEVSGQSFIVQNVGGNSGATGSLQALSADPDGYTILFNHTAFAVNYFTGTSDLTYDDLTFGAVCAFMQSAVLVARPELGITKLSQIKEYCDKNPGGIIYGASSGTTVVVPGLNMKAAGIDITMVDSGGTADRMTAVLGGHVDFVSVPEGNAKDYLATGELVQIEDDMGVEIACPVYHQMLFPKGTDEAIVAKLNSLLEEFVLTDADYAKTIKDAYNMEPFYLNAEEGAVKMAELWDEWAKLDWGNL